MSASVTTCWFGGGLTGVIGVLLPQPARFSAATAPALAPTPARNLRRETPLSFNILNLATCFSPYTCGLGLPVRSQSLYVRAFALDLPSLKIFRVLWQGLSKTGHWDKPKAGQKRRFKLGRMLGGRGGKVCQSAHLLAVIYGECHRSDVGQECFYCRDLHRRWKNLPTSVVAVSN